MLKTDIYKMSKEKKVKFGRRSGYIFLIYRILSCFGITSIQKNIFTLLQKFHIQWFFPWEYLHFENFCPPKITCIFYPHRKGTPVFYAVVNSIFCGIICLVCWREMPWAVDTVVGNA